ncbi:putative ATP-BINDING CASSETTE TRANSPORTER, partial [Babesia divergens]
MTKNSANKIEAVRSFNEKGILSFLFLKWVPYWINKLRHNFIKLSALPPLPNEDRISYWQPIFSKHVSDGLLGLEKQEAEYKTLSTDGKKRKLHKSALLRALILTFWRRVSLLCMLAIIIKACSVGITILIKFLLDMMSRGTNILWQVAMVLSILSVEVVHLLVDQHIQYYKLRTEILMEAVLSITLFQHGLCHRKDFVNDIDEYNLISGCKDVVHSCEPGITQCSENSLMCPAKRHRNKELSPDMYTYLYFDTINIAEVLDAMLNLVRFISAFVFGMIIISKQLGVGILKPIIVMGTMIASALVIEFINGIALKHLLYSRDFRLSKIEDVIGNLDVLKTAGFDDVGYNSICDSRKDELSLLAFRIFFFFINQLIIFSIKVVVVLVIMLEFIDEVRKAVGDDSFDFTAPITLLFLINKIVQPMNQLPRTMRLFIETFTSCRRLSTYLNECSPNYYLNSDERIENSNSSCMKLKVKSNNISGDTVVMYKGATFAWIESREEILNPSERRHPIL